MATVMVKIRASQVVLVVKNLPANAGDLRGAGLIPGSGRHPGGGTAMHSILLPGKSHGQRILVGYSPLGHKELDMIEKLNNNNKNDFSRLANKFEDKISFQLLRHSDE